MSQQLGLFNFEQEVPHTAGSDCRDWNPCPPEPTYADLKQEALKQMYPKQPSTTTEQCLVLSEQVKILEERYAREHAWLNEAAEAAGCDLDQVANVIRRLKREIELINYADKRDW